MQEPATKMQVDFFTGIFTRTVIAVLERKLMTMSDKRSLISKSLEEKLRSSELAEKFKTSRFVH